MVASTASLFPTVIQTLVDMGVGTQCQNLANSALGNAAQRKALLASLDDQAKDPGVAKPLLGELVDVLVRVCETICWGYLGGAAWYVMGRSETAANCVGPRISLLMSSSPLRRPTRTSPPSDAGLTCSTSPPAVSDSSFPRNDAEHLDSTNFRALMMGSATYKGEHPVIDRMARLLINPPPSASPEQVSHPNTAYSSSRISS
jgi:hypothetical protein